ncbi:MAG TPA: response regulator, partial [Verrucomicrobiales bacterium]|nr:response regulator [Verrucomicrobiales bacterium]
EGQPEELCGLNGKRVLVLEDDAKIRRLISATLGRSGCEVIETADGRDTLRRFQEDRDSGRPVDLIICDLTIVGGLGGVETMHEIRRLDGEVPAIVSSGYSDAPAMAHPEEYGFNAVLPKPYPPSELRRMVLETLEAKIRV